jgi:hypothetical protein
MKFLAVEAQTQQDSGSDKEQFYQKCKLIVKKSFPTFGCFIKMHPWKEYLQEKPEYMAYCKLANEENEKKKDWPIGTKRAKHEEKDGKIIQKALKEAGCHKQGLNTAVAKSRSYDKAVGDLEQLCSSVIDYWRREEEAKLVQCLNTPDRKK